MPHPSEFPANSRGASALRRLPPLLLALLASTACAQDDVLNPAAWSLQRPDAAAATLETTEIGFRATINTRPDNPWNIQLSQNLTIPVTAGQVFRYRLWIRSETSTPAQLIFERNGSPFTQSLLYYIAATPEWTEHAVTFTSRETYPAGGAGVRIRMGFATGTIEFAGIALENWSTTSEPPPNINYDPFAGRRPDAEAEAAWRAAAEERIEKLRKADVEIHVVDANDQPISGAAVTIEQQRHHFGFGTAIANTPLFADNSDGENYRARLLRLFNYVTFENQLKWTWANGTDFSVADRMFDWCEANNLPVRGHNLFWPSYQYLPATVRNLRGAELREAIRQRILTAATHTRGRVVVWDVINEAVTNTEVTNEAGRDLLWLTYQWTREVDPDVKLVYNDYNLTNSQAGANARRIDQVIDVVKLMQEAGAGVQILGVQGHISTPLTPGPEVLSILDRLHAELALPIEVTEFDVGLNGIRDEEAQGRYLDEYLTAVFSHPHVSAFILWGFWDGAHWRASEQSGLFRRDWSPRPQLAAYENLVLNKWWTRFEQKSTIDGTVKTRAFLGTHKITATLEGRTITAPLTLTSPDGEPARLTLRLPNEP